MKKIWKNYANFSGRASRRAFRRMVWLSALLALPGTITLLLGLVWRHPTVLWSGIGLHMGIGLLWLTPFLALCVRRKHDLGKSGWSLLGSGHNTDLFWGNSESGANPYGPEPEEQ